MKFEMLIGVPLLVLACEVRADSPRTEPVRVSSQTQAVQSRPVDARQSNPYVAATLPPTGHVVKFKRFPVAAPQRTSAPPRPAVSTYLNLLSGGDPGLNYYLRTKRDQEVFATAQQTRQINSQVNELGESSRVSAAPTTVIRQPIPETTTPLKRQIDAHSEGETTRLLQEIRDELRVISGSTKKPQ